MWLPALGKYAMCGYPVAKSIAAKLKCPVFDITALTNPHQMIGLAQHLPNNCMVKIAMLACVELFDDGESSGKFDVDLGFNR